MTTIDQLLKGDLVSAARRKLLDHLAATPGMLGPGGLIGQDGVDGQPAIPGNAYGPTDLAGRPNGWVFPGLTDGGLPFRPVEGTGKVSVSIVDRDHWGTNQHNTMAMPLLRIFIFADTLRDANLEPLGRWADLMCRKVGEQIDLCFHNPQNDEHVWNPGQPEELDIVACVRSSGGAINVTDIADNDYAVRGVLFYEVSLQNWG